MRLAILACFFLTGCTWHVSGKPLISSYDQCRAKGTSCVEGAAVTLTHPL